MYRFVLFLGCVIVSVTCHYDCHDSSSYDSSSYDSSSFEDYSEFDYPPFWPESRPPFWPTRKPPTTEKNPKITTKHQVTKIPVTTSTVPSRVDTPPPILHPQITTTTQQDTTEIPVTSSIAPLIVHIPRPPPTSEITTSNDSTEVPATTSIPPLIIDTPRPPSTPLTSELDEIIPPLISELDVIPPLTSVLDDIISSTSESDDQIPPLITLVSRLGEDMNTVQEKQTKELNCLRSLDSLIASRWQEEIDKVSVKDLGNFSTLMRVPSFNHSYSNPESEWIQEEGMALEKLDQCFRNLAGTIAPGMTSNDINCLNNLYENYIPRENDTLELMETYFKEDSREQLAFRSFYTYFDITELLFDNRNIESLDAELRAVYEDLHEFYIKTESDKLKKSFIIEQECEWKNARLLKEVGSENERYQKFGQLVKSLVNRYLTAEILRKWSPGTIIPEFRYNLWNEARQRMEEEIMKKLNELREQKRDVESLCTYAGQLADKFFLDEKEILFNGMKNTSLSFELKTQSKYAYVLALGDLLKEKQDNRLSHAQVLIKQFKEGHYCFTNFVRLIENHQRDMIASTLTKEVLPYGITYCQIKELSTKLLNPRYCKCQGTFCEEFGLATIRAQRYQLIQLPNNTYTVITNSSYQPLSLDELINSANWRIAQQKFDTWWYYHQKVPA